MHDLMDLRGRVALVTGGNSGIGLGMCRGLARAGAVIAVVGRNDAKNSAAASELQSLGAQVLALQADVTRETDCQATVLATRERFGRLDILVNNAGVNIRKAPQDYSLQEWATVIETNLTSAFLCSQAAYPVLVSSGGWQDHQHRVHDVHLWRQFCSALQRQQGRHRSTFKGARHGLGQGQHPGQRDSPWLG